MENQTEQSAQTTSTDAPQETNAQEQIPSSGEQSSPEGGTGSEGQSKYDLEGFNKHFGSSFEDESSLKSILESPTKISDYESQLTAREEELKAAREEAKKYHEFVDYFDPKNLFGDEQTWKMVELRKKFPNDDPAVVQQILDSSFNNLTDIDKLILADKLKVRGNIPEDVRLKGIFKKMGIEADDLSDLSEVDRYAIASAVSESEEAFNKYRSFVPEDMKFDIVKEKQAREEALKSKKDDLHTKWKPLAESLIKNYKEAKFVTKNDKGEQVEVFKFTADEKFQSEIAEPFMATLLNSGMEPNTENLKIAADYLDERFKVMNFNRIVNEAVKHGMTLSAENIHKEIHNDKAQNTSQAPNPSGEGEELTLKEWAKRRRGAGR